MAKNKSKKKWTIILIAVFVLIIIATVITACFFLELPKYCEIMAVVGVVASLLGIIVTLTQVSMAIDKTEAVQEEVIKHSQEIRSYHNATSFNSELERAQNIMDALSTKEYRYLRWRIAELKDFLVRQKPNPIIKDNKKWSDSVEKIIMELGVDVQNLISKMSNRGFVLDLEAIVQHMNAVVSLLAEISGYLENDKYGKTNNA